MECPYCDGHAKLKSSKRETLFRKESFIVNEYYYKCDNCNNEFSTTDIDTITMCQLYNQYRERHKIPFPDEINKIREMYSISSSKMSMILGLGINSYGNYEKGEIPTKANTNLIKTAANPNVFLNFLENSRESIGSRVYNQVIKKTTELKEKEQVHDPVECLLHSYGEFSQYTGYSYLDLEKIGHLTSLFLSKCNPDFNDRLKLNKLLFYTDFINYKRTGKSITGLTYRAIQYGPVPANYDLLFTFLEKENIINPIFIENSIRGAIEKFESTYEGDTVLFTEHELETINDVIKTFKNTPSWELVDISHKEKAWKDLHNKKEIISYQDYAFDISIDVS